MKRLPLLVVLGMLGVAGSASAQSRRAASRVHDFHTLDRLTPMTTFDFSLGWEFWSDPKTPIGNLDTQPIKLILPIDLHFHLVTESGLGGYATLPLTEVTTRDVIGLPSGESKLLLGNIDVGGMYAMRLGGRSDFVAHLGVALPTATDDDDHIAELFGDLGALPRLGDAALRYPNTTFLRLGVSPMGRFGIGFWQFDAGVDIEVAEDDDATDVSPIEHLGVGAGVELGQAEVTGELNTVITNFDGNDVDNVNSTLAFGARFKSDNVQPGFALVLPMSIGQADHFDLALLASLSARLP